MTRTMPAREIDASQGLIKAVDRVRGVGVELARILGPELGRCVEQALGFRTRPGPRTRTHSWLVGSWLSLVVSTRQDSANRSTMLKNMPKEPPGCRSPVVAVESHERQITLVQGDTMTMKRSNHNADQSDRTRRS